MATFDSKTILMMAENGHSVEIDGKKIQLTIVQDAQASKKQPDYSHLVGKWVRCVDSRESDKFTIGKYYPVVGDLNEVSALIDDHGLQNGFVGQNHLCFDLSNPLDHNPDDVRVFDVPSEIKISEDSDGLSLFFSDNQALWYSKTLNCYGVILTPKNAHTLTICVATECKFEDLQEGDLFFATDKNQPDFTFLSNYYFLDKVKNFIWVYGYSVRLGRLNHTHYFKITPKP